MNSASPKDLLKSATANMMADIIKRSRARFAALPQSEKDRIVRRIQDDAIASARA